MDAILKKLLVFSLVLILAGPVLSQEAPGPNFLSTDSAATSVYFNQHPLRYRLSHEMMSMQGEPNLGILGIGADFFIVDRLPNFYLSLNSYSAVLGKRPGLITFGTGAGYVQPLFNSPFSLDFGVYIGGGGGGGAPDGGGLITREHLNLSYKLRNFSVFMGYSRLDFPTGDMGSHNFNAGISLSSLFRTAQVSRTNAAPDDYLDPELKRSKSRINISGQNYLKFAGSPTFQNELPTPGEGDVYLLGVEVDQFFHEKWYAALKLHGAVAGGIDGYMSYLVGLGVEHPIGSGRLLLDAQLLAGPSGGGNVATGGGGIIQGALGLRARLGDSYSIKAGLGQTFSPGGQFRGTFLELALAKNFQFISSNKVLLPEQERETVYGLGPEHFLHRFGFEIKNRTYFSPKLIDKNGYPYDRAFQLLGFQISKIIHKNFDVSGATYWAYQGSYGAYAEGLLGLGYRSEISPGWTFRAQLLGGAAGGGGIDLGSGLVFQYSAGLMRSLSENWGFALGVGQMQGVRGNFKPYFVDAGIAYRFSQLEQR